EMIVSSSRYHVQESSKSMYETKMTMIVRKFQKDDVGSYRCIAKNSLEIPGPNRKNPAGKHAGGSNDADTNDVLKMKQVKVTYQPDDEDLYGSAEDFDDSELPSPPLTPNIYYANGQKSATHRPAMSGAGAGTGIGGGSGGQLASAGGASDGRHHHHNSGGVGGGGGGGGIGSVGGIANLDFGNLGATSGGGISISSGFAVAYFGSIARKPPFYDSFVGMFGSKTEVRDAVENNELRSAVARTQQVGRFAS
ncbi:PREDICTED: dachshund homolog 1-like, partial [Rhagoletis zephyria]|uniref:dachshund homolog 1-like n=1 Tax=Rhagoletis zephyria TaxID=28612 RepID=UPI0008117B99